MKYLYLILAVILLICLSPMPYGYFSIVRVVTTLAFSWLAYKQYVSGNGLLIKIFIGLAILFQPFIKIPLGRTMWNVVDVAVAIGLLVLYVKERNCSSK